MKKTDKNETPKATQTLPIRTPLPETDEERQARADRANQAIREILQKESCILTVPNLDISTGRVVPTIQLVATKL